jgi:hypothetical protein
MRVIAQENGFGRQGPIFVFEVIPQFHRGARDRNRRGVPAIDRIGARLFEETRRHRGELLAARGQSCGACRALSSRFTASISDGMVASASPEIGRSAGA